MPASIRPTKLADTVVERLETLILEGSLRPGERLLPERELALKFDVSRPTLREALGKLIDKGLLYSGRGGATHVAALLDDDFTRPLAEMLRQQPGYTADYLEFRGIVEGAASYLAALRGTDIDRDMVDASFAKMEAAHQQEDPTEEAETDADFHIAVYEASHNMVMLHFMRALSDMLRNEVFYNRARLFQRRGVRELLLNQHRAVHDAVMAGDPLAARASSEAHIHFTREALQEIAEADARLEASLRRIAGEEVSHEQ